MVLKLFSMMFTLGHSHSHSHNDPPSRAAPEDTSSVESSLTTQNSNEKTMLFNRKYSESRSYKSNQSINVSKHELSQTATRRKEVEDLNVRAALIHVIGDLVQSVGVFIASLLIYFKVNLSILIQIYLCEFFIRFRLIVHGNMIGIKKFRVMCRNRTSMVIDHCRFVPLAH